MNAKHTVLALSLLALAGVSHAGDRDRHPHGRDGERGHRAGHDSPRESFTEETVRKSADGKTARRKVEQKVTDTGFSRKSSFTNPEGKTATREVNVSHDKNKKTFSRSEKGTDFDGKSWSREFRGEGLPAGGKLQRRGGEGRGAVRADAGLKKDADASRTGVKTAPAKG